MGKLLDDLIWEWEELVALAPSQKVLPPARLRKLFLQTHNAFLLWNDYLFVPREATKLILTMDQFEFYTNYLEEVPASKYGMGIKHLVTALKNGFLEKRYVSDFLHFRVTAEGIKTTLGEEKKMYQLNLATISDEEFDRYLKDDVQGDYDGMELLPHDFLILGSKLMRYSGKDSQLKIPAGITEIADGAVRENTFITDLILPEGLETIGGFGFIGCENLERVTLPESLKTIDSHAFTRCGIRDIQIPQGVIELAYGAFAYCTDLTRIRLPEGITNLAGTFCGCENLQEISIPATVQEIGTDTFNRCKSLKKVEIPQGVTRIGVSAFCNCPNLESVTIPATVTEIETDAFEGTEAFENCEKLTIYAPKGSYAETYAKQQGIPFQSL